MFYFDMKKRESNKNLVVLFTTPVLKAAFNGIKLEPGGGGEGGDG